MRVSSNENDTNIDLIMNKMMYNRIAHSTFDPVLGFKPTRKYVHGLVFQGSELAPYKKYVHPGKMADLVTRSLEVQDINKSLPSHSKTPQEASNSFLPFNLGANVKDFQRAKWLAEELKKKSFHTQESSLKYDIQKAADPEVVQKQKWA